MSRTVQPLDCPFCGGQCLPTKLPGAHEECWQVFCGSCRVSQKTSHNSRELAIATWNKRVIVTDQKPAAYLHSDAWTAITATVFNKAPVWLRTKWLDEGTAPLYTHPIN